MKNTTVLIVEDEAIVAADLASKLGQLGYEVIGIAERGEEAVELACCLKPEVVLMDIRLKGAMDGIEAAEAILGRHCAPVIYLTAHSDAVTLERAKVSQPFGYILKPFEERELTNTIEMALYKHQSDRQLHRQREWLLVTLASIGDAVISCDTAGRVNFINPVAEELIGWSIEEARDWSIKEVFRLIDEQTGRPMEDPVALALREERTKTLANHVALMTRDGREIPIEESTAPILDADGRVIGVVIVFHDVAEKRRTQEVLRESEARLQAANEKLQLVNEDLQAANEEMQAQAEELQAQNQELAQLWKESERTREELRRARDAAEAATRAKSQFLANMSHELRTPMTGILGMLDLALSGDLEENQRDFIETAHTSARSMVRILNDILDLTKIAKGKFSIEENPFSIRKSLEHNVNILLPLAKNKGLALSLTVDDNVPQTMIGDQVRLGHVLTNLTGNAVKFTEKGKVEISVAAGGGAPGARREVSFTVSDTGIGIPDDKKGQLFQVFSQVDDSHSRIYGGTGLGLAISKEIVERMGGTIGFTSKEGRGSTFSFTIPFAETEVERYESISPGKTTLAVEATCDEETTEPRLLIVEDDQTIIQVLGSMLRMAKYEVDFAENGQKAVELWENESYDLILMDIQMPRMNGFEATAAIRAKERSSGGHIPIIAMTAHAFKEDEKKCLNAGMDAYISKPIDFMACLQLIRAYLSPEGVTAD